MADSSVTLAVIGLGKMGQPMAERLASAGFGVAGFDVDDSARQRAGGTAIRVAATAGEAVRLAQGVILMLPNSDVVDSVLADDDLAANLAEGATVIDMSSSEPLRSRKVAENLASRGVRFVDAPVSGGVKGARNGRLTIMAGGAAEDVARVTPWLQPMGQVVPTGDVGSGHAMKALNNLLSATHLLATTEALLAGERIGLDPATMISVFNHSSGKSGSTEIKFPNFILPKSYDSGFALRLMVKDMRIALGIANFTESPHELSSAALALWEQAARALPSDADHTEIERWDRDRRAETHHA